MSNRPHLPRVLAAIACSRTSSICFSLLLAFVFYVGAHHPEWLARTTVPLCVSVASLKERIFVEGRMRRAPVPRSIGSWICDSGGFTELSQHGRWRTTAKEHAAFVLRAAAEIGGMTWASPQDWMCEPWVIRGGTVFERGRRVTFPGTGLTLREHQRRTVDNLLELRALAPTIQWTPVIQGWTLGDYLDCIELYDRAGVDLRKETTVGIGSVCRRQSHLTASNMIRWIADDGILLHGYGFKVEGLETTHDVLASADSMSWSDAARFAPPIFGHTHKKCNNCMEFALDWRADLLSRLEAA
jgi:hypothetical protein